MRSIRSTWLEMKGILKAARQIVNRALEPLGLSGLEGDILFHLLSGGDTIQQEQLADWLDIGKAAVSRALDSLESKGFVRRVRYETDRRSCRILLTERALAIQPQIEGIFDSLYAQVCSGIADSAFEHLDKVLARVSANLAQPMLEPIAPAAVQPTAPAAVQPTAPAAVQPIAPAAVQPIAPATLEPIAPSASAANPAMHDTASLAGGKAGEA